MRICFFLLTFVFYYSYAQAMDPIYDISFGIHYQSLKVHQGVIFYRDFQLNPDLNFKIINDHWEFVGDSLNYSRYLINDKIKYRSKLVEITDRPYFPQNKNIYSRSPHRNDSTEWINRLEFNFLGYSNHYIGQLAFEFGHDLFTHHGDYFDLETKIKLFKYKFLEPDLFASLGFGDLKNNQYYYGKNANRFGTNNFEIGLNILVPEEVDRYYSVAQIHYFEVLNQTNKNADFSKNNNHGFQITFTMVKNVY